MNNLYKHNVDNFNRIDSSDSYLSIKKHRIRESIVIELLDQIVDRKLKESQKLLSIACSTGRIEKKIIKKLGITVYGIDAAEISLKEACKHGIITKHADVSKTLPFEDNFFDFVFAGEIIEHLLDTKLFLSEINRILKLKGYLILTTPNLANFIDRLRFLFGKAPRQTSPLHPYLYLHIRPFTFDSLQSALKLCGFKNITLRTNVFAMELYGKEITLYSKFLTQIFPSLGSSLIVRTKKIKNLD